MKSLSFESKVNSVFCRVSIKIFHQKKLFLLAKMQKQFGFAENFKCSTGDNTKPIINKLVFLCKLTFRYSEINRHVQRLKSSQ